MMSKNIRPVNAKGQCHGYWEIYRYNGKMHYKCIFHNDKEIGYEELYKSDGKLIKFYHL